MALRNIRKIGDDILRKKSKKVEVINDKVVTLVNDMFETMYKAEGVGLAAPQVGILKKIVVIDTTGEDPITLINPEIIEQEGSAIDEEGCLSIPGEQGNVERPTKVTVKALNIKGEQIIIKSEDLLARAICHEIDHLYGILYIDKIIEGGD